jgi:superfamily II DNA or RNA helicase
MKLRDYQINLSNEANIILNQKRVVALCMEVRTGKTLTALQTAQNYGAKSVLFVTKIKAFSSIQWDYDQMDYSFKLTIINKESLHKLNDDFDFIIYDEFHGFSAYPKPSVYQKLARQKYSHLPMILLSGTPTPESHSQWFHSFHLSDNSPFKEYANFYKWAKDFVNVKTKHLGYAQVNDYSEADIKHINRRIKYYVLTFTQKEAGFTSTVNELVLEVPMLPITYQLVERLKKDLVVKNSKGQTILADTGVKLQQKIHQLYSGTCKFEDGTSKVIDYSKAEYIRDNFKDYKIGIFYKFKEEWNALKEKLGDKLTNDLDEFNTTDKWIALQITSGREGISLKMAKYLVYYNIDFSAVSYWQSRDRLTTMDRKENDIFWIFAKGGIEDKIYRTVLNKKDFTLSVFKKEYGVKDSKENYNTIRSQRFLRG